MFLLDHKAKICLTASGVLIHQQRVLLVKHKKLGLWLNPGGHIELDEAPHQAAEREFLEETGLTVRAQFLGEEPKESDGAQFVPSPFLTNVHWVCEANYRERQAHPDTYQPAAPWKRGCEQHLNFVYLMHLTGTDEFQFDATETDDIAWFDKEKIKTSDIRSNILSEIHVAFALSNAATKK